MPFPHLKAVYSEGDRQQEHRHDENVQGPANVVAPQAQTVEMQKQSPEVHEKVLVQPLENRRYLDGHCDHEHGAQLRTDLREPDHNPERLKERGELDGEQLPLRVFLGLDFELQDTNALHAIRSANFRPPLMTPLINFEGVAIAEALRQRARRSHPFDLPLPQEHSEHHNAQRNTDVRVDDCPLVQGAASFARIALLAVCFKAGPILHRRANVAHCAAVARLADRALPSKVAPLPGARGGHLRTAKYILRLRDPRVRCESPHDLQNEECRAAYGDSRVFYSVWRTRL